MIFTWRCVLNVNEIISSNIGLPTCIVLWQWHIQYYKIYNNIYTEWIIENFNVQICHSLHFAWVVDDVKCIVVTRVCVSVYLSVRGRVPTLLHGPDITWGSGKVCPLVVQYWADMQSVHELRCYDNITRTRNISEYMLVLALCLVLKLLSIYNYVTHLSLCLNLDNTKCKYITILWLLITALTDIIIISDDFDVEEMVHSRDVIIQEKCDSSYIARWRAPNQSHDVRLQRLQTRREHYSYQRVRRAVMSSKPCSAR